MITLEQAKKLKAAGFPQPEYPLCTHCGREVNEDDPYRPTISELIESFLGFRSFHLGFSTHSNPGSPPIWVAHCSNGGYSKDYRAEGATPEEAVVELYIAINKK